MYDFTLVSDREVSTYDKLSLRLRFLDLARSHLENLLKERNMRSSFVSHVSSSFLREDKVGIHQEVPTIDVQHHLNTINLQMEVTKFFNSGISDIGKTKFVTLFGNGKERAEIVIQILMFCCEGSIPLASKIIQVFKLPSVPIVSRAVKRMTHLGKYDVVSLMIQQAEANGLISSNGKDEILLQVINVMITDNQNKNTNHL